MTATEEFSFRRTLEILGAHDIYVIGPNRLAKYFSKLRDHADSRVSIRTFEDKYFSSVAGYNRLLMSRSIYKAFEAYEYILVVQTDALVLADHLNYWCDRGYSYVGAPWFSGLYNPSKPLSFVGVGNGGFSLRKVHDLIRVLSFPRHIPNELEFLGPFRSASDRFWEMVKHRVLLAYSFPPLQPRTNEDFFWGMLVPRHCDFFTVPSPREAAAFAFEAVPEHLYELNNQEMPFGCHAWERYNPQFWRDMLRKRGILLPESAA